MVGLSTTTRPSKAPSMHGTSLASYLPSNGGQKGWLTGLIWKDFQRLMYFLGLPLSYDNARLLENHREVQWWTGGWGNFHWCCLCNCPIFLYQTYEDPTVEAEFVGRCFELGLEGISKREMKRIRCPVVTGLPVPLLPGAFWEVIFKVQMEQDFKILICWMVSKTV